jgi:HD domain
MGSIGYGYGSEWHLLAYLGRRRDELSDHVRKLTGATSVEWLDFPRTEIGSSAEWKGLDFIGARSVQNAWKAFWPQHAGIHNWDAVARIDVDGTVEWLLVEAKAHLGEIESNCGAKPEGGRGTITAALELTKKALGVGADRDWLNRYYQFCNRIAVADFLRRNGIPTKLLFIYFTGDFAEGRECPSNEAGWRQALAAQDEHIGLPKKGHALETHIHKLFLPVIATARSEDKPADTTKDAALILKATQFAAEKHRVQRRKDKEASPYINHPIAVATMLATVGRIHDVVTLSAAILHDTIEDTETTPGELERLFGAAVRALVVEVTDDKSLPKEVRKRLQIEHAVGASREAKAIKLGDKICNVTDVTDNPPADWSVERRRQYLDWTDQVIAGCRGTNKWLEQRYDKELGRARTKLC